MAESDAVPSSQIEHWRWRMPSGNKGTAEVDNANDRVRYRYTTPDLAKGHWETSIATFRRDIAMEATKKLDGCSYMEFWQDD